MSVAGWFVAQVQLLLLMLLVLLLCVRVELEYGYVEFDLVSLLGGDEVAVVWVSVHVVGLAPDYGFQDVRVPYHDDLEVVVDVGQLGGVSVPEVLRKFCY